MKVLVVDDEPSVRKLIQRYLGDHGYEVDVADNGADGWAAARDGAPDLILSDVAMPEMDGYELVRMVRRNPATAAIPIILLSANRGSEAMVEGYRSGADDYIAKPVDVEVLRHKIDALVRRSHAGSGAPAPVLGRLVCVTSAKGGTGVTTVAANLAVLLCRRNQTVCAADLDLEHGDLQVLLDLRPQAGIAEASRDLPGIAEGAVQWDDYLVHHSSGAWLLAAPATPLEASSVTETGATVVIEALRTVHDFVLVDVPPSYRELALSVYEAAERVLVVTTPEITALRRSRELFGVLEKLGVAGDRVAVVLNHLTEKGGIDRDKVETFLHRPVNVVIPFGGRAFTEAVNGGRPVVMTQKGRAIDSLAEVAALL
jgi:pilus assembly protein CpaE